MASFTLVVLTNAATGVDEEFNHWYSGQHIDEVLALEPFSSAQRFVLAPTELGQPCPYRYLTIYQVDAPDADTARAVLRRSVEEGVVCMSETLDRDSMAAWYFEPITDIRRPLPRS